jgi:hypothetical protein
MHPVWHGRDGRQIPTACAPYDEHENGSSVEPFYLRYDFMILLPAFRFLTGPLPPDFFAARLLAATILPPRVFFIPRHLPLSY